MFVEQMETGTARMVLKCLGSPGEQNLRAPCALDISFVLQNSDNFMWLLLSLCTIRLVLSVFDTVLVP